ncbi:MAG TPA: cation:proton antiporter [Dehalococcoidia bacterium]|nr:cation:proton antiporter [Dehalococcoidia bacterium]
MQQINLLPLLIITALAFVIPLLTSHIRWLVVPSIVGEIIGGIIIGKSGFDLIQSSPWLDFLYLFGFALLMFMMGLEIDLTQLLTTKWHQQTKEHFLFSPMAMAIIISLLTFAISFAAAYGLSQLGFSENIFLLSLILCTAAVATVVPVIKQHMPEDTPLKQVILLTAIISDVAVAILVTLVIAIHTGGLLVESIASIFALFAAFFFVVRFGVKLISHGRVQTIMSKFAYATWHPQVRGAIVLMMLFVVLAQWLGIEFILGALLAGIAVSPEGASSLEGKLDALGYGFFIPIFFIMIGVRFDLLALVTSTQTIILSLLLIIAAFLVKVLPSLVLCVRYSLRHSLSAGILLSSRLGFTITVAAIALEFGAINTAANSAIILLAIISSTVAPILFARLLPKS